MQKINSIIYLFLFVLFLIFLSSHLVVIYSNSKKEIVLPAERKKLQNFLSTINVLICLSSLFIIAELSIPIINNTFAGIILLVVCVLAFAIYDLLCKIPFLLKLLDPKEIEGLTFSNVMLHYEFPILRPISHDEYIFDVQNEKHHEYDMLSVITFHFNNLFYVCELRGQYVVSFYYCRESSFEDSTSFFYDKTYLVNDGILLH